MRSTIAILLLLLLSAKLTYCQISIDTIQVTAMQVPLSISETGRNISVLTAGDISALPANSIDEILQTIQGVEVQSRGGFGVQGDILLRGSTYTQVLILLDGMQINDPLTGHFNSYMTITPAEIERIEILRGAAAAMYGSGAVGGVINIISKTFAANQIGTSFSGDLNYGEHKLIRTQQGFHQKLGKTSLSGGFSMNQSAGEQIQELEIDSTTILDSYHNFFDLKTVGFSAARELGKQYTISLRSAYDHRHFGARYFYTSSPFDKSEETVANWWNQIQLKKSSGLRSTDVNLAYKYNTDRFVFSPDFASTNVHTSQLVNFTANHLCIVNTNLSVKAGLQADRRSIESNDRGDHENFHFGAYAMAVYRRNAYNLSLSLRADYDDNYKFEPSPQVNFSYVLPRLVLRASVGRSIRAADYTERFVSNNLTDLTPGRSLGNPDLEAERSWSEELGLDYQASKGLKLKATVFARQSTNLIDYVSTNQSQIGQVSDIGSLQAGADYFFARNISEVGTNGLELEADFRQKLGGDRLLAINLGYTFVNTENDQEVVSVYISSHAKHLLSSRLSFTGKYLDLSFTSLFKQRQELLASAIDTNLSDSYFVCHSRIGLNLTEQIAVNFQIQNLFDEAYQNILGAKMPGRWLMAGVRWRFL